MTALRIEDGADFHLRWRLIGPPQRPLPSVAEAIHRVIGARDGPLLLLGVTPELAAIPREILAIDWNAEMLRTVWPGDTGSRRAIVGDWREMPGVTGGFAAAIGDGSLNMLRWPDDVPAVAAQIRRVLQPDGIGVFRCFASGEEAEPLDALAAATLAGALPSFRAYKLRHNMAVAMDRPGHCVLSEELLDAFEAMWPDRQRLAAATGWTLDEIGEIDIYRGLVSLHSYPPRSVIRARWEAEGFVVRFVETEGYPLAELCPLLVLERAG